MSLDDYIYNASLYLCFLCELIIWHSEKNKAF